MNNQNPNKPVELLERKSPPILTGILILLVLVCSFLCQSAHNALWLHEHAFQANKILSMLIEQKYGQILAIIFYANFTTINIWQTVFSIYFLFTFGFPMESRFGPTRFVYLIILSTTLPWLIQYWDVNFNPVWHVYFEHPKADTYFFGPVYILAALAGAYMTLIPRKKSLELYIPTSGKEGRVQLFKPN